MQPYDAEPDLSTHILATLEKFSRDAVQDYQTKIQSWPATNHVEARILGLVADPVLLAV